MKTLIFVLAISIVSCQQNTKTETPTDITGEGFLDSGKVTVEAYKRYFNRIDSQIASYNQKHIK